MSQLFQVRPETPQPRLLGQVAAILREGGIIAYPTDCTYALGCCMGNKAGTDRIRAIRALDERHHLTLVCRDLSEIATYARLDNAAYRLLKQLTPGPYTFLLRATREVPRRLQEPKRKTIGIRVPDSPVVGGLLEALGEPMLSSTLQLAGDEAALTDPYEIRNRVGHELDAIVDAGIGGSVPTSVIDLVEATPRIVRRGCGPTDWLER